ncbi:MAG: hypothetical protein AAF958_15585 [Planctomycetota bacterium]
MPKSIPAAPANAAFSVYRRLGIDRRLVSSIDEELNFEVGTMAGLAE